MGEQQGCQPQTLSKKKQPLPDVGRQATLGSSQEMYTITKLA